MLVTGASRGLGLEMVRQLALRYSVYPIPLVLGLTKPDPNLSPDPSIKKQKSKKKSDFILFYDFFLPFLSLKTDVKVFFFCLFHKQ